MSANPQLHDDWDAHWDDYADSASLNPAQKYRREVCLALLDLGSAPGPARLIDIGSGQGDFAAEVRARHSKVEILGVELSQSGVDISTRKVPDAIFLRRNLLESASPGAYQGWANLAVCSEVLEHVDDPAAFLRSAKTFMAPGCRLIVTVPGGPRSAFERHIGHRDHFTRERLRRLLEQTGFEVESATGAGFPFFNLYKCAGYLRGERLVEEVRRSATGQPASRTAMAAMSVFRILFHFNLQSSPWGWQIVGIGILK
jgi:SAM-dependent methyltransferase